MKGPLYLLQACNTTLEIITKYIPCKKEENIRVLLKPGGFIEGGSLSYAYKKVISRFFLCF